MTKMTINNYRLFLLKSRIPTSQGYYDRDYDDNYIGLFSSLQDALVFCLRYKTSVGYLNCLFSVERDYKEVARLSL